MQLQHLSQKHKHLSIRHKLKISKMYHRPTQLQQPRQRHKQASPQLRQANLRLKQVAPQLLQATRPSKPVTLQQLLVTKQPRQVNLLLKQKGLEMRLRHSEMKQRQRQVAVEAL